MSGKKSISFERYKNILNQHLAALTSAASLGELDNIKEKHVNYMRNRLTRGYTEGQRKELISLNEEIKKIINEKTLEYSGNVTHEIEDKSADLTEVTFPIEIFKYQAQEVEDKSTDLTEVTFPIEILKDKAQENGNKRADLTDVTFHIEILKYKAQAFKLKAESTSNVLEKKTQSAAYQAASTIVVDMEGFVEQYKNDNNLARLKQSVKERLNETDHNDVKLLQGHRGWKEVLTNLLTAILCLPIYMVEAVYKGTFFPLKPKTDSAVKLDNINQAMDKVIEPENLDLDASNDVADPENNSYVPQF